QTKHCTSCKIAFSETSFFRKCDSCRERARNYARHRAASRPTAPAAFVSELARMRISDLGTMNVECNGCGALHWEAERATN
ncbi:hypothetical protein BD408DRAFT_332544, partial [Parasitella parasitica]